MTQNFFDRLLLVLNFICIVAILQIKFFHIPFNCFSLTENNIASSNDIIFNLSISIIASYIFYIINIKIVNYFKEKKTQKLIDNYLSDILTQMQIGQLYLERRYFSQKDFSNLHINDFNNIITLNNIQINFHYTETDNSGRVTNCHTGLWTEIDMFCEEMELVKNNIKSIFSFPYITSLDFDLVILLHKIQTSYFYIGVSNIKNGITYVDFNKYVFECYVNFKKLKTFATPNKTISI